MAPTEGSKLLGKLSRGFTTGVQTGVSSLMSVNALLQDAAVRQKAGQLISRTAKQVLPGPARRSRPRRRTVQQEESECDLQVGSQVYERVPLYMRTQLWKSLLIHADAQRKTAFADRADEDDAPVSEAAYYNVLQERNYEAFLPDHKAPGWEGSCAETIFKDVRRTFPGLTMFVEEGGVLALWRVLRAYSIHDPQVGYCQGMNFVAGLLLLHLDEGSAFAALTLLLSSKGAGMRGMYAPSMELLHLRLRLIAKLLHVHAPRLHAHLDRTGASIVIFTSPWLLSVFASEFPMNFAGRVMDMLLAERSFAVVLRVALQLLMEAQEPVLALHDLEAIVNYFKREVPNWSRERLNKVLNAAAARADITDHVLATFVKQFEEEDAAAASRPTTRNAVNQPAIAESLPPETVPIQELLGGEVPISPYRASGGGLPEVGGSVLNAADSLEVRGAESRPGSLLLEFDAPAIKRLILEDYWSDKDDGLDEEDLDDGPANVSPRVARSSEYGKEEGGAGSAHLSGREHRGSHTVQVNDLSSGSWRLVELGSPKELERVNADQKQANVQAEGSTVGGVEPGFHGGEVRGDGPVPLTDLLECDWLSLTGQGFASSADHQPSSSHTEVSESAASAISSTDPVALLPPSQSQLPLGQPLSEGVGGNVMCGATGPTPAAAPRTSAVQEPPAMGGLLLDLVSCTQEGSPVCAADADPPDLSSPAHRLGLGDHANPPLLDINKNNNNSNNHRISNFNQLLSLESFATDTGSETWMWAQADEELSQNHVHGDSEGGVHDFGQFVQGGVASSSATSGLTNSGSGLSSWNHELGGFASESARGVATDYGLKPPLLRWDMDDGVHGFVESSARATCTSKVEMLPSQGGACSGMGSNLQGGAVPDAELTCPRNGVSSVSGHCLKVQNQQSQDQLQRQQMQSLRPHPAAPVGRPPTCPPVSNVDSGGIGRRSSQTDPRKSATCGKLGHGSAATPLMMQPLPVELFSEVAKPGGAEPQRAGEPVVELFGDFVDIGEELKKGKHEEIGYLPCGAQKQHL